MSSPVSVQSRASAPNRIPKPFQFTGSAGEYFKIWIVNIVLSVLTLGIYSAWAKVRNKRYFYGNTLLDNTPFVYHAKPLSILKGRLIAVGVLAVYGAVGKLYPLAQPVFWILFVVAFPWLLMRSLKFNAVNSSYRNLRFGFDGGYGQTFKVMVLPWIVFAVAAGLAFYFTARMGVMLRGAASPAEKARLVIVPILVMLTGGLLFPFWGWLIHRFVVQNHRYGTASFRFGATVWQFYKVYLIAFGLLTGAGALVVALALVLKGESMGLLMVLPGLVYLAAVAYVGAALPNAVFNGTKLSPHRFKSKLRMLPMMWLYLSNVVAIMLTVGLMIPWARVRMAHYRLSHLALMAGSDLDRFIASSKVDISATGEELADMLDIGIAL